MKAISMNWCSVRRCSTITNYRVSLVSIGVKFDQIAYPSGVVLITPTAMEIREPQETSQLAVPASPTSPGEIEKEAEEAPIMAPIMAPELDLLRTINPPRSISPPPALQPPSIASSSGEQKVMTEEETKLKAVEELRTKQEQLLMSTMQSELSTARMRAELVSIQLNLKNYGGASSDIVFQPLTQLHDRQQQLTLQEKQMTEQHKKITVTMSELDSRASQLENREYEVKERELNVAEAIKRVEMETAKLEKVNKELDARASASGQPNYSDDVQMTPSEEIKASRKTEDA